MRHSFTGFLGHQRLASGTLSAVVVAAKRALECGMGSPILIFDDRTGQQTDVDTRGTEEEIQARYAGAPAPLESPAEAPPGFSRGRGRPKLGVIPREITLLPRHWDWLAAQPGGPSVTLRKLVEEARRMQSAQDKVREKQERAYNFMAAMAGDMPGFEEATRALFANDGAKFAELVGSWPHDVRDYALQLAFTGGREEDL